VDQLLKIQEGNRNNQEQESITKEEFELFSLKKSVERNIYDKQHHQGLLQRRKFLQQ